MLCGLKPCNPRDRGQSKNIMTDEELLKAVLSGKPYLSKEVVSEISDARVAVRTEASGTDPQYPVVAYRRGGPMGGGSRHQAGGRHENRDAIPALVDAIFLAYSTRNEDAMEDLPIALAADRRSGIKATDIQSWRTAGWK